MTPYTTTKQDFTRFKQEVRRMLDVLGLMDWSVTLSHAAVDAPVNAQIQCNHPGRIAQITLNTTVAAESFDPQRCARHEVFELLLAPLVHAAASRVAYPDEIESATHGIIRRLEHVDRMTRSLSDYDQDDPRGWTGHPEAPVPVPGDLVTRQGRSC